jgi:hypothetical protein
MGYFFSLSKSTISGLLDASELSLLLFGLLLVWGIFGEYQKLPKRMMRLPKEVFEILVMIGVAGELFGDGGVFLFSHRLQTLEGANIQVLDKKAEKALADANEAGRKAKNASDEADVAKTESGKAKDMANAAESLATGAVRKAESFETRIVSATTNATEAESHLADALERARRIEQELTWRTISDVQVRQLRDAMSSELAGVKIGVDCIIGDSEGLEYAQEISAALAKTPVVVPSSVQIVAPRSNSPLPQGVYIEMSEPSDSNIRIARPLQQALLAAGIYAPVFINKEMPHSDVNLLVGVKPRPKQ